VPLDRAGRAVEQAAPRERARMAEMSQDLDPLLERFASTLRLAQSALEEAREMADLLGDIDRRFDVRKAVDGAARLVDNVLASVDRARES
jgi:hypothetical protein